MKKAAYLMSSRSILHAISACLLSVVLVLGGGLATAAEKETQTEIPVSTVRVDGKSLFILRGFASLPSEKRVAAVSGRIVEAAKDASFDPATLQIVDSGDMTVIYAGKLAILGITEADSAEEGAARSVVAKAYVMRIQQAIVDYRVTRSANYLLWNSLYAVLALGALWAFFLLSRRLLKLIRDRVTDSASGHLDALEEKARRVLNLRPALALLLIVLRIMWAGAVLFVTYLGLSYVLGLFPWTREIANELFNVLLGPLHTMGLGVAASLPGLAFIVVLVFVIRYVLGMVKLLFNGVAAGNIQWEGFDPDWAVPSYRLLRFMIIAFGVVVAYPYIPGSSSEAFKGVSLFLGLLISLGSSSVIGNVLAGYTMVFRRAFRVGDRIEVAGHVGEVTEVRLLVTHLRTVKNEEVVVPNSLIINGNVVNYSSVAKKEGLILHTEVGIGFETPWRQVEAMLLMAADRTPNLARPFVRQKALGDFAVTYEINAYTNHPELMPKTYSDLHANIQDVFNEYEVQIMTPNYEADTEIPKLVKKEDFYMAPAKPSDNAVG